MAMHPSALDVDATLPADCVLSIFDRLEPQQSWIPFQYSVTCLRHNLIQVHVDEGRHGDLTWESADIQAVDINAQDVGFLLSLTPKSVSSNHSTFNCAVEIGDPSKWHLYRGLTGQRCTEEMLGVSLDMPSKCMMVWYGHCLAEHECNPTITEAEAAWSTRHHFNPRDFDMFFEDVAHFCRVMRALVGNRHSILSGLPAGVEANDVMMKCSGIHVRCDSGAVCFEISGDGNITEIDLPPAQECDPFDACLGGSHFRILGFVDSSVFFLFRNGSFIGLSTVELHDALRNIKV